MVSIASAGSRSVMGAVKQSYSQGKITNEQRGEYLTTYKSAVSSWKGLSGQRRSELGSVIAQAQRLARLGWLTPARMPAVFLTLKRNREWWASKGAPASGARVTFKGSRIMLQYYPGQGLQIQVLGNCGNANGYWGAKQKVALEELLDELVTLKVVRPAGGGRSFVTLEYYFPFGGGSPPWFSGMAQATCIQALARGAKTLKDDSYNEVATSMLPAFWINTTKGVRVPMSGGSWYALYNFDPGQVVLNGQLQALLGLYDFYSLAGSEKAYELFQDGSKATMANLSSFDTGAWSLYSKGGSEADLNYHKLQTEFLQKLCKRTEIELYCEKAERFSDYLKEPPEFNGLYVYPKSPKSGRTARFGFKLSKVSTVTLSIRSGSGKLVSSRSYYLTRGSRSLSWAIPKWASGSFSYTLRGVDLAGNVGQIDGTFKVVKG